MERIVSLEDAIQCTVCLHASGAVALYSCVQCTSIVCITCLTNILHQGNPRCPYCRGDIGSLVRNRPLNGAQCLCSHVHALP